MYQEFKRFFGNRSVTSGLFLYIHESKLEVELVAFYPRNWFVGDKSPEILIFTKSDIVRVVKDYKALEVEVYKDFKVTKLAYFERLNDRNVGSKLELTLKTGDRIILDPTNDNNEDLIGYCNNYIKEIFNTLKWNTSSASIVGKQSGGEVNV